LSYGRTSGASPVTVHARDTIRLPRKLWPQACGWSHAVGHKSSPCDRRPTKPYIPGNSTLRRAETTLVTPAGGTAMAGNCYRRVEYAFESSSPGVDAIERPSRTTFYERRPRASPSPPSMRRAALCTRTGAGEQKSDGRTGCSQASQARAVPAPGVSTVRGLARARTWTFDGHPGIDRHVRITKKTMPSRSKVDHALDSLLMQRTCGRAQHPAWCTVVVMWRSR